MESIRQRRRNRHRVKAARKQVERPIVLILNIDVAKVNASFAQMKDALPSLSGTGDIAAKILELPRIDSIIAKSLEAFASLAPPFISVEETRDYLGDPSCKFNARSRTLQCAVNPSGNCAACRHYEEVL